MKEDENKYKQNKKVMVVGKENKNVKTKKNSRTSKSIRVNMRNEVDEKIKNAAYVYHSQFKTFVRKTEMNKSWNKFQYTFRWVNIQNLI